MGLSDWMRRPILVQEDRYDAEMKDSDVNDPVWPSAPVEPDVSLMDPPDPDAGEVRTVSGVLDFITDVIEDAFDGRSHDDVLPKDSRVKAPVIDVVNRAATSWRGNTFNIGVAEGGVRIVTDRDDRIRCVVTNWGPGIAYLSARSGSEIGSPSVIQIAVNGSREFRTADEVWAYPAVPGTAQIVDVQDEYGVPE